MGVSGEVLKRLLLSDWRTLPRAERGGSEKRRAGGGYELCCFMAARESLPAAIVT
jgi:hypothetical protein